MLTRCDQENKPIVEAALAHNADLAARPNVRHFRRTAERSTPH
jgi:hypothetical protein